MNRQEASAAAPSYFDTHAHIQEPEFNDDVEAAIERAHAAGVLEMVVPAVDLDSAMRSLAIAERHDGIYATAGLHPHDANRLSDDVLAQIDALLTNPQVVAVGELGLDYFRMHSTRQEQLEAIEKQLVLAEKHLKPIIVHCRDAWEDAEAVLTPWAKRVRPAFGERPVGVLHYFSGSVEQAFWYVELGFMISMHTSVTHPRAAQMREVAAAVPLERLVMETDSPYGAPQAYRGKRNEPAYVVESCKQIALERGIGETEVAKLTTANARRLFGVRSGEAQNPGAAREHASRY